MASWRKPAAAIMAAAAMTASGTVPDAASGHPRTCAEDRACWHWPTMGNGARGILATDGTRRVVRACGFARLENAGRIDWSATPRLRGDAYARRWGCKRA